MGQYDIFVYGGLAAAGMYFVITNPDWISGLFPKPTPEPQPEPQPEPDGNGGGGDGNGGGNGGGGGGSADCKKACSNCWCKSYNEKCGGSCSKCNGGNRVPSKCGLSTGDEPAGKFGDITGGGGGGGTSSKSEDCKNFCNKGWCESYRSRGCTGGCVTCAKGGIAQPSGASCPQKVYNSNCAGNCRQTCWRSRVGTKILQVCVSKGGASACTDARSAFLKKYANLAKVYHTNTYPYAEAMRITVA